MILGIFSLALLCLAQVMSQSDNFYFYYDTSEQLYSAALVIGEYKPHPRQQLLFYKTFFTHFTIICNFNTSGTIVTQELMHKSGVESAPELATKLDGVTKGKAVGGPGSSYTFNSHSNHGGIYYCATRTNDVTFLSNNIEILDVYYYNQQFKPSPRAGGQDLILYTSEISNAHVPIEFKCGVPVTRNIDIRFKPYLTPTVSWVLCTDSYSGCKSSVDRVEIKISDDSIAIKPDGTLIIKSVTNTFAGTKLVCFDGKVSYAFYHGNPTKQNEIAKDAPLHWSLFPQSPSIIKAISDLTSDVVLRTGLVPIKKLAYLEPIYVAPSTATYTWLYNGNTKLPVDFYTDGKARLLYPRKLTFDNSGTYSLKISYPGLIPVTFTYNVKVVGPPEVSNLVSLPSVVYKMVKEDLNLTCLFIQSKEIGVYINDVPLKLSRTPNLERVSPAYLNSLRYKLYPEPLFGDTVTYSVNLYSDKLLEEVSLSHTVTFVAVNDNGAVRASTRVRVLPLPKLKKNPVEQNCTSSCLSNVDHTFTCDLNRMPYSAEDAEVQLYWERDGVAISTDAQVKDFLVDNLDGTLTLKAAGSDSSSIEKTDLLKDALLRCRIKIYPKGDSSISIYDSSMDSRMSGILSARVQLIRELGPAPVAANLSWIAAVVIAVLIILIVIIIIVYMLMRSKEVTYAVDAKERAQGNDPEREIQEHEIFHPYERPEIGEEAPVRGSHFSLNDSVGVGSESEGELEEYDLDPGKFNEEGSFIGQYANDPRKKSGGALPNNGVPHNDTQV